MHKLKLKLKNTYIGIIIKSFFSSKNPKFSGSKVYWEQRYNLNKNSGSGSYGRLATFKAKTLNAFVEENKIEKIIEFGCGDGNQLSLAQYPLYIGFDVSKKAVEICTNLYKNDKSKQFYVYSPDTFDSDFNDLKGDLVLSLDVLYHLIEDNVFFDYMNKLFSVSTRYVIIYSSNYNDHFAPHVKCREFTDWVEKNVRSEWMLKEKIENKYPFDKNNPKNTSMADFYIYEKKH